MFKFSTIACICVALLAGCGGGNTITGQSIGGSSSGGSSSGSSGGSSSSGGKVAAVPAALTATSSATSIPSDGSVSATITVLALNSSNNLISGVPVTFDATSGGIAITNAVTNSSGAAVATLSTAGNSAPRTITVTATAAGLTATVKVQVVATSTASTSTVSSLVMSSSSPSIFSDGSTTATISALAVDAAHNVLAGVPVTFSATSGAIQAAAASTDATGTVTATLTTGGSSELRTITVTGTTASITSTVNVNVVAPATPTTPVYTMGNGSGSTFVPNQIGLAVSGTLAAGGTAGVQVTIVNQTNTPYTSGTPLFVTFNSKCIANGLAQIIASGSTTPTTTISTTTGTVNASYVATGCSGADLITASASGLKGTGLGETSTVIFKVTDSSGGTPAGVPVSFTLDTDVGGLTLSPATATTLTNGTVQTVVSAGTVHTVVRVTASIASPALSTQSSQLTVTTGLPASAAFSIATGSPTYGGNITGNFPACPNVEAWAIDGVTVPVIVALADRYNNPVPDGTAVAFTTDGGHIVGNCSTPLSPATSGDGQCQVNWTSANPRPGLDPITGLPDLTYGYPAGYPDLKAPGRATVLATTIGEESFNDLFGSGYYQSTPAPGDPFFNLGEPYRDDNENGQYDLGEYFLNFDQNPNGTYQAGSGSFVGITCTGSTPGSTCSTSTLAIGASHLIIMSTSVAAAPTIVDHTVFTVTGNDLSIAAGATGTVVFNIKDLNGNSMAAGTTVGITLGGNSAIGTLTPFLASAIVGCNSDLGGDVFGASFAASTAGSSVINVTVTSPSGTVTTGVFGITVN